MAQRRASKSKTTAKSRRTQKKRTKKGKVYIAPYRIIILCAAIIAICMGLLVVSTALNQKAWDKEQTYLEEEKKEEARKAEEKRIAEENRKNELKRLSEEKAREEKLAAERAEKKKKDAELAAKKEREAEKQKAEEKKLEEERTAAKKNEASSGIKQSSPERKKEEPVRTPSPENKIPERKPEVKSPAAETRVGPVPISEPTKADFNFPAAKNGAQLVILLDDGGHNLAQLQKFLELPFPITIAVLPKLTYSKQSADRIRQSGKELMLHQPMQAVNPSVNPGAGAITPDMDQTKVRQTLFQNVSEIGPVAGFNNHEGSLITADPEKMESVLKFASENDMYFLDSRTNVETKVPAVARELGLSYYERNGHFLDNVKTRDNVIAEIRKNLDIANRDGVVIMIGHIWSADFLPAALMEVYPELVEKGYTFKTVSACRGLKR